MRKILKEELTLSVENHHVALGTFDKMKSIKKHKTSIKFTFQLLYNVEVPKSGFIFNQTILAVSLKCLVTGGLIGLTGGRMDDG